MVLHHYKCLTCSTRRHWGCTEVRTPESTVRKPLLLCAGCSPSKHVVHVFTEFQNLAFTDRTEVV